MKTRTLTILCLAAIATACNQTSKRTPTFTAAASTTTVKNHLDGYPNSSPLVEGYVQYLRTLDTTDLATSESAFHQFQQLFRDQSPGVCDTGFMLFWRFE